MLTNEFCLLDFNSPHPKCGVLIFIVDRQPHLTHLPPITWQSSHTTVIPHDSHTTRQSSHTTVAPHDSHPTRQSHNTTVIPQDSHNTRQSQHTDGHATRPSHHTKYTFIATLTAKAMKSAVNTLFFVPPMG